MDTSTPRTGVDAAQLDPVCSLGDPTRRRLYDYVVAQLEPVTRDQASSDLDIDRSTVAYHLDKLVDEGLLAASFARPAGRSGPGAGRPAKHYERSGREFAVSVPPRDYRLAAELLARAAEADTTGTVRQALDRAAEDLGRELATDEGDSSRDLLEHLARQGFEPYADGDVIRLRNCPFHRLARQHTELVCGMNLTMLTAVTQATGSAFEARLDPAPDRCCVAFVPTGD
ncbi:MAG TPA: helix-turn-helix domain-containing protein [Nitriliruptorales bacterium]|nr:helix-turn-helix domain-containing protein [Nitriliruptorales bacterium]